MWIKEILSEFQLVVGKNVFVDFVLEVVEECENYFLIIRILFYYCCLKSVKYYFDGIEEF